MLNYTGERLATQTININTIEHLHRYAFVLELVKDKYVLDIACGEGYGSNLIAKQAKYVFGVDIDSATIKHANSKYSSENLKFIESSTSNIPLESDSVDIVVSFETIEHHDKHEEMMQEISRVLKPDGILIISSPEKSTNEDIALYRNEFHIKELYFKDFNTLLSKYFQYIYFYDQKMNFTSLITPKEQVESLFREFSGNYNEINSLPNQSKVKYNIAIASNTSTNYSHISVFDGQVILNHMTKEKEDIYSSLTYKTGHIILYPLKVVKNIFRI